MFVLGELLDGEYEDVEGIVMLEVVEVVDEDV